MLHMMLLQRSAKQQMKPECVVSVEIISVKSLVADEPKILVESQRGCVVDFRFQHNLSQITSRYKKTVLSKSIRNK